MVTDADVDAALRQERIRLHRKVLKVSIAASAAIGLLLGAVLWTSRPDPRIAVWLGVLALALLVRGSVGWAQRRDPDAIARAASWLRNHRVAFAIHGVVWASVTLLDGTAPHHGTLELMVFALAAITAGAFITITFDLAAALTFAAPPVLAMAWAVATHPDLRGMALWMMGLLFVGVTAGSARRSQHAVGEGVRLRLSAQSRAEEARRSAERADSAYRQLADQHQLLMQILQTTRQGFWFIDNESRTTDLNPAMAQLLGRPREEILGRKAPEFFVGEDQHTLQSELAQRAFGRSGTYEVGILRPDGTRVHCVCHASPIRDAGGVQLGSVGIWTDISVRRQAEAMLRGYELVVNSITDLVSVVDTEERYMLVNDAWCRATGVARSEALGRASPVAAPSTVTPERRRALRECVQTGQIRTARGTALRPGLSHRLLETTYFPHRGDDGRVQVVALVTRDITEQESQRLALEARAAEQRAFLEAFPGYFGRLDAKLVFTYANQRLAELMGRHPAQMVGRSVAALLGSSAEGAVLGAAQRVLAGEQVIFEHRQRRPRGDAIDLQVTLTPGIDPQIGEPAIYVYAIDITRRKAAEQALRSSETELRALLAAFPGYIAAVNRDLVYTYVNERTAGVMGRGAGDVVGLRMQDVQSTDAARRILVEVERALAGQPAISEKTYALPPDGRRLDLEITHVAGPVSEDGRQTIYAFGIDITARKRAEEALIAARDEAERANRAKSQFLSQMSHELRTPLNAILGFGQLLSTDGANPLSAQQQAWAREILRGAAHLLELINDILDLGRIEAGELALEPEAVDLGELATECLGLVQSLAASRQVALHPAPARLKGMSVAADRRRLKQVLLNLLGNAIKYNRPGGEVTLAFRDEGTTLWLAVRDEGPGIPLVEQERLFQPFERLSAKGSGVEGTGIGLALSRRLLQAMGGSIGVDSTPGMGSTFWLRLPPASRVGELPAAALEGPAPATTAEPDAPARQVLYIEDNTVNVLLMEAMLARLPGVRVLSALHPAEGLRLARDEKPALVLLDIQLPDMDGFEVLAHLRQDPATAALPVVAVSANALQSDIDAALAAGFDGYLTKPVLLDEVLATVQRMLAGRPPAAPADPG